MLNIYFYVTQDDNGDEKYVICIDGLKSYVDSLNADELGNLIKQALEAPIEG